jgi:hypothetical protein
VSRTSAQPSSSFACLKPVLDPGSQAEGVADRLLNCAGEVGQVGHELPRGLGGQVHRIGGDLEVTEGATPAK